MFLDMLSFFDQFLKDGVAGGNAVSSGGSK
jgi:hypothetical protein